LTIEVLPDLTPVTVLKIKFYQLAYLLINSIFARCENKARRLLQNTGFCPPERSEGILYS
jgi:hypothetical protein